MPRSLAHPLAIVFCLLIASVVALVANGGTKKTMAPQLQARLRLAMQLTTSLSSSNNITQGHQACNIWSELLLNENNKNGMPQNIQAISFGLQASCLTRVGQDELAILAFESSLILKRFLTEQALQDVLLGKGYALQRLMRYNEARDVFSKCHSEQAVCAAATCSLRLSDVDWAMTVLKEFCNVQEDESSQASGMLGTILYLNRHQIVDTFESDSTFYEQVETMLRKGATSSPLYEWIYLVLVKQKGCISDSKRSRFISRRNSNAKSYLCLAEVNQSPFDDPALIRLDDKVLLHKFLESATSADVVAVDTFWPKGFVLPRQALHLKDFLESSTLLSNSAASNRWILKQRAGYGSHGNQLVSSEQVMQYSFAAKESRSLCLCQQVVEPPLLIEGKKISMRVYVVYFFGDKKKVQDGDLLISRKGLVKFAYLPYDDSQNDERMHMTNSGREETMMQQDFVYLQKEFETADWSYNDLWENVRNCVRVVMNGYMAAAPTDNLRSELGMLGVPKILGFDFLLDAKRKPWLLEVNRFPGLEARSRMDEPVKQDVVRDAWQCAAKRVGIDFTETTILEGFQSKVSTSSLEPL